MKKITGMILVMIILAAISCSSRKKYSDIKSFVNEVAAAQDEFFLNVDKSSNADEMVTAVDTFGVKLVKLSEKSIEIKKNYPDIDKLVNDPPVEIKADLEKLDDTESRFQNMFLKEKFKLLVKDKKVQTAFIELNKKIENLKFFQ